MAADENPGERESLQEGLQPAPRSASEDRHTGGAEAPLNEDLAVALLKNSEVSSAELERLSKNGTLMKSRKLRLALVEHAKTPRHVSMPLVRHLYTFDLVQVALAPAAPADVKFAAEEALINRLESVSSGEKLSLARLASGMVAGALLVDSEQRVVLTALDNSRLTESAVFKALMRADAPAILVQAVCHHAKWSVRREVRVALLRNQHTPLARALEFARSLPAALAREVLQTSRLPENIKVHLLQELTDSRRATRIAHS